MTICLGAICADMNGNPARALVVASDRMVTLGGFMEFEHENPKLTAVTTKAVALIAGDALRGSRLVREISAQIPAGTVTVQNVTEALSQRYVELRREQVTGDLLTPRGIDMAGFYQGGLQQRMLPQLAGAIDQQIANFNYNVDLLIGGIDDTGSHLYSIGNPGGAFNDFQQIGFHAIGSGAIHALQSLIGFGHMHARGLHETVFNVYASKRRAEVAPGVGHDTDLAIILDSGIIRLSQEKMAELEEAYKEYYKPVSQELKDKIAGLSLLEEEEKAKDDEQSDTPPDSPSQ